MSASEAPPPRSDHAPAEGLARSQLSRGVVRLGALLGAALALDAVVQEALVETAKNGTLVWTAACAAVALALLLVAPHIADHAAMNGMLRKEVARGNLAAAVVSGAHHVGVGVLLSRCLSGLDASSFAVSLLFFAIGFTTLLAFQWLYRRLTRYADDQEVRGDNAAAALSFAGVTIALSIIIGHATWGSFLGWANSLRSYGMALLLALLLYPVRRFVVRRFLLGLNGASPSEGLDHEIAQERNAVVGALEGMAYVATALLVTGISS